MLRQLEEFTPLLFTTEWGQRASLATLFLTSCLLLYVIIHLIFDWQQNFHLMFAPSTILSQPIYGPPESYAPIYQAHLFGETNINELNTPLTSLQMELTGIIHDPSGTFSRAIISEQGRPGKIYRTGDVLESGVKLQSITDSSIILKNGNQFEKLPLRHPEESNKAASPASQDSLFNMNQEGH